MIDYIVTYKYNIFDDIESMDDIVITLEQVIQDKELLEDVLFENLKEQISNEVRWCKITDFEEVVKRDNLYRFEYKDVYEIDKARYDYDGE